LSAVSDKINTVEILLNMEHAISTLLVRTSCDLWNYLSRHLDDHSVVEYITGCTRNCDDSVMVKGTV
jgi:hypothetical protein